MPDRESKAERAKPSVTIRTRPYAGAAPEQCGHHHDEDPQAPCDGQCSRRSFRSGTPHLGAHRCSVDGRAWGESDQT
jgi:hypothetical protein